MSTRQVASRVFARAGSSKQSVTPIFARAASSSTASASASTSASSSSTSSWQPALPAGELPAYDAALAYLSEHQSKVISKLEKLKAKAGSNLSEETVRRIDQLEIEAYSNDPAIRREFRETGGKGQMNKSIYRWLSEQKWKKEGGLDLLMQRLLQMNIVPDLLHSLPPTSPLTLSTSTSSDKTIEPGSIQMPSIFSNPPILKSQLYHHPSLPTSNSSNPEALHTLLVIDPDSPSHETHSFQQRLHYLKTDIPLSVLSGELNLLDSSVNGKEVLKWESPAPEQGTPNHRYVFLLFRQPSSSSSSSSEVEMKRDGFDLRDYLSRNQLNSNDLVGIDMFRSKWSLEENEYVNKVYINQRNISTGSPIYGKVPKQVKYGYPMSAKRQTIEEIRENAWNNAVNDLQNLANDVQGLSINSEQNQSDKVIS
ncbi:uncharacterized protein L201_006886 [Kwoniella dendrophila CBS 6074]|uniref:PEBP-like protein n=1 Tax=Kwoniella dendrophila CBS 6074 TaxID=1295534 RepID=A0AAX4K3I5_9TREE